jgi:hypothetical protein
MSIENSAYDCKNNNTYNIKEQTIVPNCEEYKIGITQCFVNLCAMYNTLCGKRMLLYNIGFETGHGETKCLRNTKLVF